MATIEITVEVVRETDAGLCVSDGAMVTWLPKSLIAERHDKPRGVSDPLVAEIEIPEWLAVERGFV